MTDPQDAPRSAPPPERRDDRMPAGVSVLIVDDEEPFVRSLLYALKRQGLRPRGVHACAEALAAVTAERPDVVLLDLRMPGIDGMGTLERLLATDPDLPVIMISAHGDTRAAVQAVKAGARDYLTKPFDLEELLLAMASALDGERLRQELDYRRRRDAGPASNSQAGDGGLIGDSPAMAHLRATVDRVAGSTSARILLLGESGTGKALVARAIHARSPRAGGPFVEVNCAALPEQLIEAELFGAEKGAYTGAHQKRTGLVTLADKGTLFLDEIGELPLPLQAKVLHFLENGVYRPVGSGRAASADVRVVAATNRDLAAAVQAGTFRGDLYYRLNVIGVFIPALRERGEDVLRLARHFALDNARQEGCAPIALSPAAEAALLAHPWPGNVRELKNLIERLTILHPGRLVTAEDLPADMTAAPHTTPAAAGPLEEKLADQERTLVLDALKRTSGHKGRAAEVLGISRHALKRRLHRLGLRAED